MKKIAILVFRKEKTKGKYYTLASNIFHMLESLGYLPILLPSGAKNFDTILDQVDGLLIPGGPDICPKLYKQDIAGALQYCEYQDRHSLEIIEKAYKKNILIFGICRGMQLLNIYFGGTLKQHIAASDVHNQLEKRSQIVHTVDILDAQSVLGLSFQTSLLGVNSLHHQAIDILGEGLKVVAVDSQDKSIIEAVENAQKTVMGVQWHPENLPEHYQCIAQFFK